MGWEVVFVSVFGVVFIVVMLVLAVLLPHPTQFQSLVFRTTLALSAAGIAATLPGFLSVSMDLAGLAIRAGGAIAVFALIYRLNPAETVTRKGFAADSFEDDDRIMSLEQLKETIELLTPNQKHFLSVILAEPRSLQNLARTLKMSASEVSYRGEDLVAKGLLRAQMGSVDRFLRLSRGVTKLIAQHGSEVENLLKQGARS